MTCNACTRVPCRGKRCALALVAAGLSASAPLSAHGLGTEAARHWTWEPVTIVLLAVSAVWYAAGVRRLWRRAGRGRGLRTWEASSFYLGLVSIAIALLSPVAWLSGALFSVHMTQHEILMLLSAPLLVFGQPLLAMLWALPPSSRDWCGRWTRTPAVSGSWRTITSPLAIFLVHGFTIWIWHAPRLYEAALGNGGIHALEHLTFVITAALFWWAMIHGRYGRVGYGVGVFYIFLTAVHSSVLGALMTVAPGVLYPSYLTAAAAWQVDALEDQQLAGLLMWVPSALVFIAFGLALLAAWLGESEKRVALGRTIAPVSVAPGIAGQDDA